MANNPKGPILSYSDLFSRDLTHSTESRLVSRSPSKDNLDRQDSKLSLDSKPAPHTEKRRHSAEKATSEESLVNEPKKDDKKEKKSHSPKESGHKSHSPEKTGHKSHSPEKSGHKSHSPEKSANKSHSAEKPVPKSKSAEKPAHKSHSAEKPAHKSHSADKSGKKGKPEKKTSTGKHDKKPEPVVVSEPVSERSSGHKSRSSTTSISDKSKSDHSRSKSDDSKSKSDDSKGKSDDKKKKPDDKKKATDDRKKTTDDKKGKPGHKNGKTDDKHKKKSSHDHKPKKEEKAEPEKSESELSFETATPILTPLPIKSSGKVAVVTSPTQSEKSGKKPTAHHDHEKKERGHHERERKPSIILVPVIDSQSNTGSEMSRKSSEPKVHKSQSETPTSDKHKHKPKSKTSSSSQGDSSPKVHKSKSETATVEKKEKSHHDKQKPVASAQAKRKSSTTDKKPQESNQKSIWMNIFSKTPGKKYHDKESQTDTSYAADAERRLSPKVYSKQARRDGQFRLRTKWGPCHPGIAIPIVSVLTLVLRVHPCIVFGIILLLPAGKKEDSDDDFLKKQIPLPTGKSDIPEAKADPKSTFAPNELPYVVAFGAPILFIQAIALVIVCGLLFAAILKESPKLILPYIAVQIFTLILWLLLSLIAVCSEVTEESKDLSGLILISGLGAVFDLWAVMTIITSYMDIKGFSSPWDEESPPPEQIKPRIRESPTKRLVEPRRSSRHNTSHLTSPNYPAATSHPRRKRSPKPEPYMDTFWQNMNVAEKPDTARLPGSRHRKNSPSSRYPSPPGSRRYRPANTPTEVRTKYAPTALSPYERRSTRNPYRT